MPLPPLPDESGPNPAPEFVGTGRIYYPLPHATRLVPREFETVPAKLESLTFSLYCQDGKEYNLTSIVTYSWIHPENKTPGSYSGSMDLNEWQKLPPVPHP